MKGAVIRAVLLERAVLARDANGSPGLAIFGRGLWSFSTQVQVKMWVAGDTSALGPLANRSRSMRGIADPLRAQEWAFTVWDAYVSAAMARR
jgi:hypothetical protein